MVLEIFSSGDSGIFSCWCIPWRTISKSSFWTRKLKFTSSRNIKYRSMTSRKKFYLGKTQMLHLLIRTPTVLNYFSNKNYGVLFCPVFTTQTHYINWFYVYNPNTLYSIDIGMVHWIIAICAAITKLIEQYCSLSR